MSTRYPSKGKNIKSTKKKNRIKELVKAFVEIKQALAGKKKLKSADQFLKEI